MMWLISLALAAPTTAQGWLEQTDATAGHFQDATATLQVTPHGKSQPTRTIEVWQLGATHRMAKLTAPAALAGTGLLATPEGLWVHLPALGGTREIKKKQRDDAFMGTDFTFDDLARTTWSGDWTAAFDDNPACQAVSDSVCLLLTPTDPDAQKAEHLRMWIRQADGALLRVDRLTEAGEVFRRTEWSDYRPLNDVLYPYRLQVTDLKRDRSSRAETQTIMVNQGLTADAFTPAALASR